jgi:hypothetical protein
MGVPSAQEAILNKLMAAAVMTCCSDVMTTVQIEEILRPS